MHNITIYPQSGSPFLLDAEIIDIKTDNPQAANFKDFKCSDQPTKWTCGGKVQVMNIDELPASWATGKDYYFIPIAPLDTGTDIR